MAQTPFDVLRYLLAQAGKDRLFARDLGLTQARLAAVVGVSARSLMRYLRGERHPSSIIGARIIDAAVNIAAEARAYRREQAQAQGLPYAAPAGVPLKVARYETPLIVAGEREPSRIIVLDVDGMSNAAVADVLRVWWEKLAQEGGDWDLRLQARVEVDLYFQDEKIEDRSLRKLTRGKDSVDLWLPPQSFLFQRERGRRGVYKLRYPNANAMLRALNEAFYHPEFGKYASRLPRENTFKKLALIPLTAPHRGTKYQKRRGKR